MKTNRQILVAALFFLVVVLRLFIPHLSFDELSFKLLVVAAVVALLPDLPGLINRVNRLSYKDFEVDLGELSRKTTAAEQAVQVSPDVHPERASKDLLQKMFEALSEPMASLVLLGQEMEDKIRSLSALQEIKDDDKLPLRDLLVKLAEKEVIAVETIPSFEDFWNLRQRILQNPLYAQTLSKEQLYSFVDLGLRILGLLPGLEE